jgi:hypothetical protein
MRKLAANANDDSPQKPDRENVWCEKNRYFIDIDACYARSLQKAVCRRCYKSLIQLELPFGER